MHIKTNTTVNLTGKGVVKSGWEGEHDDEESKALINIGYAKETPVKKTEETKNKGNAPENKGR